MSDCAGEMDAMTMATLNKSYESLETMRKLNLELLCHDANIPFDESCHSRCTQCILASSSLPSASSQRFSVFGSYQPNFPRLRKLMAHSATAIAVPLCLVCGAPVCREHGSAQFRKANNITVCLACEHLFGLDFIIDCMTDPTPEGRRVFIRKLIDAYDRIRLVLQYSRQFTQSVIQNLESSKGVVNKVGLGTSTTGLVSGALGVAAAATILTPVGPPLLIASLLFGGSATAVQTGTELHQYYSQPNQLADRILALEGLLMGLLRTASVLRDACMLDHIRSDQYYENRSSNYNDISAHPKAGLHRATLLGAATVGRCGMVSMELTSQLATEGTLEVVNLANAAETGVAAGRGARFASRTGTNLMRTARFARFAGGAISAAIVVLEVQNIAGTIQQLQAGSPCQKANALKTLDQNWSSVPRSEDLERECERYLLVLDQRIQSLTRPEAVALVEEQQRQAVQIQEEKIVKINCCWQMLMHKGQRCSLSA